MTDDLVRQMVGVARALLDVLDGEGRRRLHRPFADEDLRRGWNYVPGEREGLSFDDLERPQRKAVHRLLASGLAPHAYAQAAVIMALEDVLDQQEGERRNRHRSDYSTLVFGEPDEEGPWGWRFEGHHVSLNVTIVDGRLSATPSFLGANPAAVRYAGAAVVRPLAQEEDLARALVTSLEPAALASAVVANQAPEDIRTTTRPRVDGALEPRGVAAAELRGTPADLLEQLVMLYVERLPRPLAV
ncbi:MAG: DUF3500 domain-containing protein, partial [Nitriliruptorales bacterium]|nr:DUF3500 domain-containing protein [Nitriliruptorales bacterium]